MESAFESNLQNIDFNGVQNFATDFSDIFMKCSDILAYIDALLNATDSHTNDRRIPVALDVKYSSNQRKCIHEPTALVSMCFREEDTFVFHVSGLADLPSSMETLLMHPRIEWIGTNINRKIFKLADDYRSAALGRMQLNCRDLGDMFGQLHERRYSHIDSMAQHTLKQRVQKYNRSSMMATHWGGAVNHMTAEQKDFCAIDIYATFKVFKKLSDIEAGELETTDAIGPISNDISENVVPSLDKMEVDEIDQIDRPAPPSTTFDPFQISKYVL